MLGNPIQSNPIMPSRPWLYLCIFLPWLSSAAPTNDASFEIGLRQYETENYAAAVNALKTAVTAAPLNADYHHWLGKAYGRLAEQSDWLTALNLAGKSRDSLELAVELAPNNRAAVKSLMIYYREAPFFLGGSVPKAEALEQRLNTLKAAN